MSEIFGVVGAGTMGNGIAQVVARAGFDVVIRDVADEFLSRGMKAIDKSLQRDVDKERLSANEKSAIVGRIKTATSLEALKDAFIVVEAVTEDFDVKAEVFRALDTITKPEAILASNTSSISITKLGAATKRPDKVIGMHFMNPVPVMKLVEIINGYATMNAVTEKIVALTKQLDKVPCVVNDYPGFIANRILMPMINEAIYSLYEGVAGVKEIDTVMKLGMAHPMGPLQLADFIGLDTCYSILNVLCDGFGNPKYAPCPLLTNTVTAGKFGVKTGEGFYQYQTGNKELVVSSRFRS